MPLRQDITTAELMALDYRYNYTAEELAEDWRKLVATKTYKTGSQFKPGMKLCQHFCDNFWQIENAQGLSFEKAWQDPKIMDEVRRWGLQGMSQLWMSWIRRAVYMRAGLANSSYYRPHFSKQIIEMSGIEEGTLYDPCAGWGGRMLGTLAAGWRYRSCEPNPVTWQNLERMQQFLAQDAGAVFDCSILQQPAETFDVGSIAPVDIVLTSPPYFNLEIYNQNSDQSYHQFDTYDSWEKNWLVPLINRCLDALNPAGISAWNVMNFQGNDLVRAVLDTHNQRGWTLVDTVGFKSPLNNIRKLKNKDVTYIFRRTA